MTHFGLTDQLIPLESDIFLSHFAYTLCDLSHIFLKKGYCPWYYLPFLRNIYGYASYYPIFPFLYVFFLPLFLAFTLAS